MKRRKLPEIPKKMVYLNADPTRATPTQQYIARLLIDFNNARLKCTRYGDRRVMKAYAEANRN